MDETATKPAGKATATTGGAPKVASDPESNAHVRETDGFQLVIDALKLNGIETIFGLPGIPITDLTRRLQRAGLRVRSVMGMPGRP